MIHELRLSGLGVIAEAACRFAPGFTAVTGETGAGKTMVVTGLGLLAGARSDPGLVRTGAQQAAVEGWFDPPGGELAAIVTDATQYKCPSQYAAAERYPATISVLGRTRGCDPRISGT